MYEAIDPMAKPKPKYDINENRPQTRGNRGTSRGGPGTRGGTRQGIRTR